MSDYAELLEDAIDALHAVLKKTEPGTGLGLHVAYNTLKGSLEKEQREDAVDAPNALQTTNDAADRDRWSAWTRLERHHRQRLVLEALGDDGLTAKQLAERLQTPEMRVSYERVYPLLTQHMEPAGEVYRVIEPWKGTKTRARWFRNTKLSGPIAELQRALEEDA